jgi:hypothetical protein
MTPAHKTPLPVVVGAGLTALLLWGVLFLFLTSCGAAIVTGAWP